MILDNSGAKIWLPGISDTDTLDAASSLCGTTAMKEAHEWIGPHRDDPDYYSRQPIMTPEMIRQLPAKRALVIRGGMSPVIARLPMAWNDSVYRAARRRASSVRGAARRLDQDATADDQRAGYDWTEAEPFAWPGDDSANRPPWPEQ